MKYSRDVSYRSESILQQRRSKAENDRNERFLEVSAKAPELISLDKKTKNVNFELLKVILDKKTDINVNEAVMRIKENNELAHNKIEKILVDMGYPKDYLDIKYECEKCMDTGFVDGKKCDCLVKLLEELTFEENASGCELELHNFSEFDLSYYPSTNAPDDPYIYMKDLLQDCIKYADTFNERSDSLLFIGNTGLGKTFMCSCIAKRVLEKGYTVIFRSILKVLEDALSYHFGRSDINTLDDLSNADLVILDDLGSEFSDRSDPILYQVINDRLNKHKPTIITTNFTAQQINERYNERIFSRLFGAYKCHPFVGNDIRMLKNDQM